ncbi:MAG: sulfotransferase [Candidatus Nanopelagicales bacterium]
MSPRRERSKINPVTPLDQLPPGPNKPIFVGGTGRSGTTVLGRLLGQHKDIALTFPMELTFFSDKGGLADTYWWSQPVDTTILSRREIAHRVRRLQYSLTKPHRWVGSPEYFVERLQSHWFKRKGPTGAPRGLHRSTSKALVEEAAAEYAATFETEPLAASRRLASRLIDPMAESEGKERWVDTSPTNALVAHKLYPVFPDAKFIHIMRDGRDAAASVVSQMWGPDDMERALRWWRRRMIQSKRSLMYVPSDQVLVIQLEDLVTRDREGSISRLLGFLGVEDDPNMRAWFDEVVTPRKGNEGRWRRDYTGEQLDVIDTAYAEIIADLEAREIPHPV